MLHQSRFGIQVDGPSVEGVPQPEPKRTDDREKVIIWQSLGANDGVPMPSRCREQSQF